MEAVSSSYMIAVCASGANVSTTLRTKIAARIVDGFRMRLRSSSGDAETRDSGLWIHGCLQGGHKTYENPTTADERRIGRAKNPTSPSYVAA